MRYTVNYFRYTDRDLGMSGPDYSRDFSATCTLDALMKALTEYDGSDGMDFFDVDLPVSSAYDAMYAYRVADRTYEMHIQVNCDDQTITIRTGQN